MRDASNGSSNCAMRDSSPKGQSNVRSISCVNRGSPQRAMTIPPIKQNWNPAEFNVCCSADALANRPTAGIMRVGGRACEKGAAVQPAHSSTLRRFASSTLKRRLKTSARRLAWCLRLSSLAIVGFARARVDQQRLPRRLGDESEAQSSSVNYTGLHPLFCEYPCEESP